MGVKRGTGEETENYQSQPDDIEGTGGKEGNCRLNEAPHAMNEEEHLVKVEEMKGGYTGQAIPPVQLFAEDNIKKMTT